MSEKRRQDLVYPPGPEAQREQDKKGHWVEAKVPTTTGRLFSQFCFVRHDEEAILRVLRQVPHIDRLHARIALFQALGGQYTNAGPRALALCERVFGPGSMYFPSERAIFEKKDQPSPETPLPSRSAESEPEREPVLQPEVAFDRGRIEILCELLKRLVSQPPFPPASEILALLDAAESHVAKAAISRLNSTLLPGEDRYGKTYYQSLKHAAGETVSDHLTGRRDVIERMLLGWHKAGRPKNPPPLPLETRWLDHGGRRGSGHLLGSWDQSATVEAKARRQAGAKEKLSEKHPALEMLGQGGGDPLPEAVLTRMNRLLGHDFSHVRVHTDAVAAEATALLGARALVLGSHIYFGAGQYAPGTTSGDRLLLHELVHIVQHDGGRLPGQGSEKPSVSQPEDAHEREAEQAAETFGRQEESAGKDGLGEPESRIISMQEGAPGEAKAQASAAQPQERTEEEAKAEDTPADDGITSQPTAAKEGARQTGQGPAGGAAALGKVAGASIRKDNPEAILDSLAQVPASGLVSAWAEAQAASPAALEQERAQVQATLPAIPSPTGLPAQLGQAVGSNAEAGQESRGTEAPKEPLLRAPERTPQDVVSRELVKEAPALPSPQPTRLAGRDTEAAAEGKTPQDSALAESAQKALTNVAVPTDAISTQATEVPDVDMSGEADPSQMQAALDVSREQTQAAFTRATQAIGQDFGENDIFPEPDDEILQASAKLAQAQLPATEKVSPVGLPPEAQAAIDAEASPLLQERIGTERARYAEGKVQYDVDVQAAHEQARQEIAHLEEGTRSTQEEAQATAQLEVSTARQDWQAEIDQAESDFQGRASAAKAEHQQKIQSEQQAGQHKAKQHIAEAEKQAESEKRKSEAEVTHKKSKAQKESKGFWGWVKSKAQALVDGLKQAVNFIFESLRKVVKAIFEAAKKLALAAIEFARKAIVGFIRAYGALLKGLVSVALAAFPEIRDRITRRIDAATDQAVRLVNQAAEALKKGVTAVLDFLANTIDAALGLLQDLCNAVFTVIGMIVSGEWFELFERLGHLIDAAAAAPAQFETAAYEELLGGDLDQPLSPAELMAAGRTATAAVATVAEVAEGVAAVAEGVASGGGEGVAAGGESEEALPGPPWNEGNVGVDTVATGEQLSPELSAELVQRTGGRDGEVTFGESDDASRSLESILGMSRQAPGTGDKEEGAQEQTNTGQEGAYHDGLTPRERAQIKWEMMKKGLTDWWSRNWPYVLGAGVLGIAGFIIANILTGGAITAALPLIMPVLEVVFAGMLVAQIAGHVRDFLSKGWNGDIQGGGKSLAKALAAGAIELLSNLTFKVGGTLLKGAKGMARQTIKGGQALVRGTARVTKGALRLARRGAEYVLRGGKVLLRGVSQGIARGVKRLRDLGTRLLGRTKFTGFRIRIERRRFLLEGKINPWVLLANGDLKYFESDPKVFKGKKVGDDITIGGQEGIIVGSHKTPSRYVDGIQDVSQKEARELYDELDALSPRQREAWIYGGKSTHQLRKGIPEPHPRGYQAHHLLPEELMKDPKIKRFLDDLGFDFQDGSRNGLLLPPDEAARLPGWEKAATHLGSHPHYTANVTSRLEALRLRHKRLVTHLGEGPARSLMAKELDNLLKDLKKGLMNGDIPLH
jgi:hypothetical protein